MKDDLNHMERTILNNPNKVIAKEYVSEFIYANRRRVRELEREIHQLKRERLTEANRAVKQGVKN